MSAAGSCVSALAGVPVVTSDSPARHMMCCERRLARREQQRVTACCLHRNTRLLAPDSLHVANECSLHLTAATAADTHVASLRRQESGTRVAGRELMVAKMLHSSGGVAGTLGGRYAPSAHALHRAVHTTNAGVSTQVYTPYTEC